MYIHICICFASTSSKRQDGTSFKILPLTGTFFLAPTTTKPKVLRSVVLHHIIRHDDGKCLALLPDQKRLAKSMLFKEWCKGCTYVLCMKNMIQRKCITHDTLQYSNRKSLAKKYSIKHLNERYVVKLTSLTYIHLSFFHMPARQVPRREVAYSCPQADCTSWGRVHGLMIVFQFKKSVVDLEIHLYSNHFYLTLTKV